MIVQARQYYSNSLQINECSQDRQLTSVVGWMLLRKPLWLGSKMNDHYTWMKLACWYCPQVRSCSYGKVCSFKSSRIFCDGTTWILEKLKVLQIWNKFLLSECCCKMHSLVTDIALLCSTEFGTVFVNSVCHDLNAGCSNSILMNSFKSCLKFLFLIKHRISQPIRRTFLSRKMWPKFDLCVMHRG